MVLTHALPPPAKTARGLGFPPPRGLSCLVRSSVIGGQETSLHHDGYGHIADRIGLEERSAEPLAPGFRWPAVLDEQPPGLRQAPPPVHQRRGIKPAMTQPPRGPSHHDRQRTDSRPTADPRPLNWTSGRHNAQSGPPRTGVR